MTYASFPKIFKTQLRKRVGNAYKGLPKPIYDSSKGEGDC